MFLVRDIRRGASILVFTWVNPRTDGYQGSALEEDVILDYDPDVHRWEDGEGRPEACIGRAPKEPKHFKVFKYLRDLEAAGYDYVPGTWGVFNSWSDYTELSRKPPYFSDLGDEERYDYLDAVDDDYRRFLKSKQPPDEPAGGGRDEVAAWVAKSHLNVDPGVREIWYLPHGAPPDEIRFVEVSDRLAGGDTQVEPMTFGLEASGGQFNLVIADVNSDLLEQVQRDPSRLPPGWSLDANRVWRRRRA